jgi:putative colanic acid biosynthesis acetyltransferase WcaF
MAIFNAHSAESSDPLLRPAFTWQNKVRRSVWLIAWTLFFRPSPTPFHLWRCGLLRIFGAQVGSSNFIYPSARIWAPWLLKTREAVTIGRRVEIYNPGGLLLDHHTIVSQDAYICGATHDYQSFDFTYVSKAIQTEPYVWICARSIVLPGVRCGIGSVLGAGSVTSRDLKDWTVYAGNPARAVRQRNSFDAQIHESRVEV